MQGFDHEKLDVYRAAIDLVALADGVVEGLPRGRASLADQLQRAATSVALNVAEGAGAAPLAALLGERDMMAGKKIGLILTGGNVDLASLPF